MKSGLFSSLLKLAAMRRGDSAHSFLNIRIHRPPDLQTHRSTKPHIHRFADRYTQRPADPQTHGSSDTKTESHMIITFTKIHEPQIMEHVPTDHTPTDPWAPSPAQDSWGHEGLRTQDKSTSWERVGRKCSTERNRREGRGQKGAEAGTKDKKRRERRRGDGRRREGGPCSPWGLWGALHPARTRWGLGRHSENKAADGEGDPQEPVSLPWTALRSCCGWGPRDGEGALGGLRPRGAPLGLQEMAVKGHWGGESEVAPAGSGCAPGSRTAERLVTLIPETAPSLAVGSQGAGSLEPVREGGEEGFSQSPPPSPSQPKVRSQRTAAWCPLVGLEDALSEALEWGAGEKGAKNPGQKNREGPSARPVGPPPWPPQCPGAGLGSSEQPGR